MRLPTIDLSQSTRTFLRSRSRQSLHWFSLISSGFDPTLANAQGAEFSSENCSISGVVLPQNATHSHFRTAFGFGLRPNIGTHCWKAGALAIRIVGECQSHVIWGIGSLIGLKSQQYVEFEHSNQTSSFRPTPYSHEERFSNFSGAPKLCGQEAVYFAAQTSPPIGVWKSPNLWTINFAAFPQGANRHPVTKIATSTRRVISAIPELLYHSQSLRLGIAQEQDDGCRIVFTFVYEKK